jgi:hypothetical protein
MKLLDWFAFAGRPRRGKTDATDLSRRDFFARVAGKQTAGTPPASKVVRQRRQPSAERNLLHAFYVEGFPSEDNRALLLELHPGLDLELRRDPEQPDVISMYRGEDLVGTVAAEIGPIVGRMMADNDPPICRIRSIDPDAPANKVLQIALLLFEL